MRGSVTRKKVNQPPAPSVMAASSSSLPSCCMSGMSSRATYGKVTNMVARMMPGSAYTMLISFSCSQAPNQPFVPNSSTLMSPDTTGDTASGRSMNVMRMLLPRNSNLAIHQAAVMPNTVLSGTTTAAVVSVRRIEARVASSEKLEKYADQPCSNAMANTAASGAASSAPRNVSDMVISSQRTSVERRLVCPGRVASSAATSACEDGPAMSTTDHHAFATPDLQQVDGQQHHEGNCQHHETESGGARVVVFLEPEDDEQRSDLGLHVLVAGDEDDRSVFTHGAREGERESGEQRRQYRGHDDAAKHVETAGAERLGGVLEIALHFLQCGLHGAHDEGHADERECDRDA